MIKDTVYYQSYSDDFVESRNQAYQLPDDYRWLHHNICYRVAAKCLHLIVLLLAMLYCRFFLHVTIKNRSVLKPKHRSGYFLYGNHTQPAGDAFIPFLVTPDKRCSILVSPANLGIPLLGKLLPMLGALPLPGTISGMKKLDQAIAGRITAGRCIVIYPEAHVWPWFTGIRPFPAAAFGYPVKHNAPAYCMTTTYQQRKNRLKPRISIYVDGPFHPDRSLSKQQQKHTLCEQIYACMEKRSRNSNYEYIRYQKGGT